MDKRISRGDDFAGDAWVRWVAVGHKPDAQAESRLQRENALLRNGLLEACGALKLVYAHGAAARAESILRELGEE